MLTNKFEIKAWLNQMSIENYTIHDDLIVDVHGDVNISNHNLEMLPIQFGIVNGDFECFHNNLTTLQGMPFEIKGSFDAHQNKLIDLSFFPKKIGRSIVLYQNKIKSLEGLPNEVNGDLFLWDNKLTHLKHFPSFVQEDVDLAYNKIKALKGLKVEIKGSIDFFKNPLRDIQYKDLVGINIHQNIYVLKITQKSLPSSLFKQIDDEQTINFNELKHYLFVEYDKKQLEKKLKVNQTKTKRVKI